MTNARGDEAQLLLRRQSTFGTAEAAGAGQFMNLPFYTFNNAPQAGLEEDDAIYGDSHPGDAVEGLRQAQGSMAVPLGLSSIGWHLYALLGEPTTTGTGPYTHVFEPSDIITPLMQTAGIDHLGVDEHFLQDSLFYTGMQLAGRKDGQRARATFDLISRAEVKDPGSATRDTAPVSFASDTVPVGFQGTVEKDGTEVAGITGMNATIATGTALDQEAMNGLATAADVIAGRWNINGDITARFRDTTWYDLGDTGAACDMHLKYALSASLSLEFEFRNVRFERSGIPITGRDVLSTTFNWRVQRPTGGNASMTATLINGVANYANPT